MSSPVAGHDSDVAVISSCGWLSSELMCSETETSFDVSAAISFERCTGTRPSRSQNLLRKSGDEDVRIHRRYGG